MENEMMNYPRMFGSFGTPRILKEGFGYEGEVFAREGFEWFTLEWAINRLGLSHSRVE